MIRSCLAVFTTFLALAPLAQAADREPSQAVANLQVAAGLEATLFAAEPMLLSPSDIDVDHLGRVWVCEVVNYRGRQGSRPAGDRIVVLEDTDHDGRADKQTVFYQGKDIDSALGICVLGNKVLVSVAPQVFVFTDDDGDLKADKKEVLFSDVGQPQHDHSTHAFVFGPDGKLYWNVGNTAPTVHDRFGKPITDLAGNLVEASGKPYRQGMVFRCDEDGGRFEVLAHNFRNDYEVCVDSFGTVWQSDNDDDGNRGVRIVYVMEHGNFGYVDELTGAGWKVPRTNLEADIPNQHWHQNDPGVVPNLLITGAGSPTGICLYEGELLPSVFRNQLIHCDAGPNICRAYPIKRDGAGYQAEIVNVLDGQRDNWFRPSDVCVAPDGSLIVADWYDPGVGGHRMGDIDKGRIFRVAPPKTPYQAPAYRFDTPQAAAEALKSPNLSARYLAFTALRSMGKTAEPALESLYSSNNPRWRARALWLLSKLEGRGRTHVERAMKDQDPDIRITALRAARQLGSALADVALLAHDQDPQVLRECALALRGEHDPQAASLWADLAARHDGRNRWYLEALGIGADGQWDAYLKAWLAKVGDGWNSAAGRDILWRSRSSQTAAYLAKVITDPATSNSELPRYLRSFDFLPPDSKTAVLEGLATGSNIQDPTSRALVSLEAISRLPREKTASNAKLREALDQVLEQSRGTSRFVELVDRFELANRYPELLALAISQPEGQVGIEAIRALLAKQQESLIGQSLEKSDEKQSLDLVRVLGNAADGRAIGVLVGVAMKPTYPLPLRQEAVRALAKSKGGAKRLVERAEQKKLDPTLMQVAAFSIYASSFDDVKQAAEKVFPRPAVKNDQPLPPLADLLRMQGDVARGKTSFDNQGTCAKCHIVNNVGKEVGPNLSEIGSKLSREAMFESILFPSAGISHNYETWQAATEDGNSVIGILTSETPDSVTLKGADGIVRTLKRSEIEHFEKQTISLMPADLQKVLTTQDLVDVVAYLTTLKKMGK